MTSSELDVRPTSISPISVRENNRSKLNVNIALQAMDHDDQMLQSVRRTPSKASVVIRRQPPRVETWVKPSLENRACPQLSWDGKNEWTFGLHSVCFDFNLFCYACMCWCCFRHELSSMMKEHWCIWFVNCWPLMELRTKFRTQYAIHVKLVHSLVQWRS